MLKVSSMVSQTYCQAEKCMRTFLFRMYSVHLFSFTMYRSSWAPSSALYLCFLSPWLLLSVPHLPISPWVNPFLPFYCSEWLPSNSPESRVGFFKTECTTLHFKAGAATPSFEEAFTISRTKPPPHSRFKEPEEKEWYKQVVVSNFQESCPPPQTEQIGWFYTLEPSIIVMLLMAQIEIMISSLCRRAAGKIFYITYIALISEHMFKSSSINILPTDFPGSNQKSH